MHASCMYSIFDVNFHCSVNGAVTAEVEALRDLNSESERLASEVTG